MLGPNYYGDDIYRVVGLATGTEFSVFFWKGNFSIVFCGACLYVVLPDNHLEIPTENFVEPREIPTENPSTSRPL